MSAAVMFQGCGSDVGKSTLVAGLCRHFTNQGLRVRPFKPQNMSNNAAVAEDGGEIGRAQALQAQACRVPPSVHMNPVLLKPQGERGAQLVVQGQVWGAWTAKAFTQGKRALMPRVLESYAKLRAEADLVIVEGAGSPAETNLRTGDIANMGFAQAAKTPVVLIGDIDRGHVIASLVGAHAVLDPDDRALIAGFVVNKFRGDPALFAAGRGDIARFTAWTDLGVAPFMEAARRLPAEDSQALGRQEPRGKGGQVKIVAPLWRRIANFDDFAPLQGEAGVSFQFIRSGEPIPGDADLVILPGSKSTLADLSHMRSEGWDIDILAHVRRGGRVLGICAGYQMLGREICDLGGVDGPAGCAAGLNLLDIETSMGPIKTLRPVAGRLSGSNAPFAGYEMHVGVTTGAGTQRPFSVGDDGRPDGAASSNGRVCGGYIHGLFETRSAREAILAPLGAMAGEGDFSETTDAALDDIAKTLSQTLDMDALRRIAGL
jgi:adenosylcobyric acid synthase